MSEDNFRKNVYEVLKSVEAKTMSLPVAQRCIMRLARRVNRVDSKNLRVPENKYI